MFSACFPVSSELRSHFILFTSLASLFTVMLCQWASHLCQWFPQVHFHSDTFELVLQPLHLCFVSRSIVWKFLHDLCSTYSHCVEFSLPAALLVKRTSPWILDPVSANTCQHKKTNKNTEVHQKPNSTTCNMNP